MQSIELLGVLLDGDLFSKEHMRYTENKVVKSIDLLYRAKPFLGTYSLLTRYYSYIRTYLNYANLSWTSTNRTNLKKSLSQQKHAIRIVNNKARFEHTKELFNSQKILNIYKLKMLNTAIFMYKVYNETAPATFFKLSESLSPVSNKIFKIVLKIPKKDLIKYKYRISSRGVLIWNNFLSHCEKQIAMFPWLPNCFLSFPLVFPHVSPGVSLVSFHVSPVSLQYFSLFLF